MDKVSWGPLLSGLIGGMAAIWVTTRWAKFVPAKEGRKDASTLTRENRWRTLGANVAFFGALISGVFLFKSGYVAPNDWRVFGVFFGLAFLAPLAVLYISAALFGRSRVREAVAAYAMNQRMPLVALYVFWCLAFMSLVIGTVLLVSS